MCNVVDVKAAINAIESKLENDTPLQYPLPPPSPPPPSKRNIHRQSPFRHSRRLERKPDDGMLFSLSSPYRTRSTSCRSCSDTYSSSLNPSPKSYISDDSRIHLTSDNSRLEHPDQLSFEIHESFQNLLGGYLSERKRTLSLENELVKTKDKLSSCYTKLGCILKDANEETSQSTAETSTLSSDLPNLIQPSPRAGGGGYDTPTSVSCIGMISPDNEPIEEKHPQRVNNEVNAYDKIVLLLLIVVLIIIVGIIVDSQL